LLEEDEDASALDGYTAGGSAAPASAAPAPQAAPAAAPQKAAPEPQAAPAAAAAAGDRIKASPLAKRLAKEAGIDLASVTGSGPNGRVVKSDIEGFSPSAAKPAAAQTAAPAATTTEVGALRSGGADYLAKLGVEAGTYDLEPLDGMRKVIAKRLSASNNNVPDFPLLVDCEIDALLAMRKELNAQAPEGVKVSVNDMLIRAAALALKHVPAANASFTPDGIAYHKNADVAVAVAIDGGLITPIVRHAENKGLSTISVEMI